MNDMQRDLIEELLFERITKEEFLDCFKVDIVLMPKYIRELLEITFREKNKSDIESLITIGFIFNSFSEEYVDILCRLLEARWHYRHEEIARILKDLKSPKTVDSLYKAATTQFEYLDHSDALAVKCIWALGAINNAEAHEKLELLTKSDNEVISNSAVEQLARIRE